MHKGLQFIKHNYLTVIFVLAIIAITALFLAYGDPKPESPYKHERTSGKSSASKAQGLARHQHEKCCRKDQLLKTADMPKLAEFASLAWQGNNPQITNPPARFLTPAQAVHVGVRAQGKRLVEIWETGGNTAAALKTAIHKARKSLTEKQIRQADTLEVNLTHSYKEYNLTKRSSQRRLLSNVRRGITGLEIVFDNIVERYPPTYVIASNRKNERLIDLFKERHNLSDRTIRNDVRYFMFDAEQALVKLQPTPEATLLQRGNVYIPPTAVSRQTTQELADLATRWLQSNVHSNGRMTYKYWPSAGRESDSNNMIRQWMATVALNKVAMKTGQSADWKLSEKNIDYNLTQFYHEEGGHGLIEHRKQVKLGAVALAAMALIEHPRREKWLHYEKALQKTIDSLWHEDGSFTTFFKPKGSNRNQNFYPGETLLYWSILYQKERNPELLRRFMKTFEYYREWHLNPKNRNPAFIPWHTQAYYNIWKLTGNKELKEFVYTMNDWLLGVQEWSVNSPFPDTQGRFYDSSRPFGPPHSSSTGVYLEGLIDAFTMALNSGDNQRMADYRMAINRGLRSVMQLQFADENDMYYISPKMRNYVLGGIRTTVYNNEIRCDNVQHNLMGIIKIINRFKPEDYRFH